MSCPLPHVLILLNLLCRPAPLVVGRNAWRCACVGCLRLRRSCGCHAYVVRISYGGWLIGSLRVSYDYRPAPRYGRRGGGADVVRDAIVACFFLISSAVRDFCGSRHCGCRGCFAMVYCHCVVREDEHGIGSSGFLSLVFLTRFPLRLTPTSSLVSTLIATTGVLLILSLRPIAHGSLLSTRLAPSAYPWRTERGVFMPIISAASWLKRRRRIR